MLKNFKKKSLKAKIGIIAFIVFMIVLVAYVLYSNFKPEPPAEYEIADVNYGSITDTLDVSGTVTSGVSENFTAIKGVMVEEVLVNVGDRVSKGDKLATFNVSGVVKYLTDAQKEYNEALNEYNEAKSSSDANASKKAKLEKDIAAKKAEITALEKEISNLESAIENTEPLTETQSIPQEQIDAIVEQMQANGATEEQIDQFISAAGSTEIPVTSIDNSKTEELTQKNIQLAQLNSELSSLQAESALTVTTDDSVLEALKSVADSKKASYESVKAIYNEMKNGWYADNNGIVTVVNLKAGECFVPVKDNGASIDLSALLGTSGVDSNTLNSLLGSSATVPAGAGITIESYDDMIVSVTVGKSDLLKIKVGMEAVITSLDSEYEGEVVYVGATAAESNGMDLGSLMGTATGATGAIVEVKIKNPDEKVVIGFDVDIKIKLSTIEDVLKIPVECVMYDNGKYSVFVYDSEEGTVVRRIITKGTLDDTSYEIIDGLQKGEKVVKSPDPNMQDGTKITEKASDH